MIGKYWSTLRFKGSTTLHGFENAMVQQQIASHKTRLRLSDDIEVAESNYQSLLRIPPDVLLLHD